jgi:membrane-associated phospholipid phosphatase
MRSFEIIQNFFSQKGEGGLPSPFFINFGGNFMHRTLLILIFVTQILQVQARPGAQPDSLANRAGKSPRELVVQTWHDGWHLAAAPRRWQSSDWLRLTALLGATGAIYATEVKINHFWQNHPSSFLSVSAKICREFGNEFVLLPAFGTLYLAGHLGNHPKICQLGSSGIRCLMIAGTLTAGLKFLAQREGPDDHEQWHGPKIPFQGQSFPSGHATLAFAAATVLAHEFQFSRGKQIAIYSLAAATAWSRLYEQSHWASDVFVGAAIGYFTTRALLHFERPPGKSLQLAPYFSANSAGVSCRF